MCCPVCAGPEFYLQDRTHSLQGSNLLCVTQAISSELYQDSSWGFLICVLGTVAMAVAQDFCENVQVPAHEDLGLLPSIKQASSKWMCQL